MDKYIFHDIYLWANTYSMECTYGQINILQNAFRANNHSMGK